MLTFVSAFQCACFNKYSVTRTRTVLTRLTNKDNVMESHVHCVVRGSVGSARELQGVQYWICNRLQVGQDKALQHLHDHRDQGD